MTEPASPAERILFEPEDGSTRVDLMLEERSVSRLWIVPFTLAIGAARVRMDGIGGVGTDREYRRRGYSRRVLEATVERMRQGDAALSMLYGIRDFYPKFGYATAGPDHFLRLTGLDREVAMPAGWTARPIAPADLPAARRLYDRTTARAVGAADRAERPTWNALQESAGGKSEDACRVVVGMSGEVEGYAWEGKPFWYSSGLREEYPDALIIAEAMAAGPAVADAVLSLCRAWAAEESARRETPVKEVLLSHPPEGAIAAAAMRQDCVAESRFSACGSSMVRVLDVERLLRALAPELSARARAARLPVAGMLRIESDLGAAALEVGPDGVELVRRDEPTNDQRVDVEFALHLPQTELARLALGAFPPEDLLARLPAPPDSATAELIGVLFPLRHPHMWIPDRY